jgi:hypothetical protein
VIVRARGPEEQPRARLAEARRAKAGLALGLRRTSRDTSSISDD